MDDLIAFLRARLDEDEQWASTASEYASEHWRVDDDEETLLLYDPMPEEPGMGKTLGGRVVAHIARHDPARVLREVQAKRAVIAECAWWHDRVNAREKHPMPCLADRFEVAMSVLRALATAYNDHPDYRENWRPMSDVLRTQP